MGKSEEGNGSTFYFTLPYKYIITPLEKRVISKRSHH
jgi:signal transduction histidine kinase